MIGFTLLIFKNKEQQLMVVFSICHVENAYSIP